MQKILCLLAFFFVMFDIEAQSDKTKSSLINDIESLPLDQFPNGIEKFNNQLDSIIFKKGNQLKDFGFTLPVGSKQYNYSNYLDFVETRLFSLAKIIKESEKESWRYIPKGMYINESIERGLIEYKNDSTLLTTSSILGKEEKLIKEITKFPYGNTCIFLMELFEISNNHESRLYQPQLIKYSSETSANSQKRISLLADYAGMFASNNNDNMLMLVKYLVDHDNYRMAIYYLDALTESPISKNINYIDKNVIKSYVEISKKTHYTLMFDNPFMTSFIDTNYNIILDSSLYNNSNQSYFFFNALYDLIRFGNDNVLLKKGTILYDSYLLSICDKISKSKLNSIPENDLLLINQYLLNNQLDFSVFYEKSLFDNSLNDTISREKMLQLAEIYILVRMSKKEWNKAYSFATDFYNFLGCINSLEILQSMQYSRMNIPLSPLKRLINILYDCLSNSSIVKENSEELESNLNEFKKNFLSADRTVGQNLSVQDTLKKLNVLDKFLTNEKNEILIESATQFEVKVSNFYLTRAQHLKDSLSKENSNLFRKNASLKSNYQKMKSLNDDLNSMNTSLIQKNSNLADSNLKLEKQVDTLGNDVLNLQRDTINLNSIIDAKNARIDSLDTSLQTSTYFLYLSVLGVLCLLVSIALLEKKRRKLKIEVDGMETQIELNKKTFEQELNLSNALIVNEYLLKHDIRAILSNTYSFVEEHYSKLSNDDLRKFEFLGDISNTLFKLQSFVNIYYTTLSSESFNLIDEEINLSKGYIEFLEIKSNLKDINLIDARSYKENTIVIPNHIINNLVKNSIEKGKIPQKPLKIIVKDCLIQNGYSLKIIDDGCGVGSNFSIDKQSPKSTGLRNILKQIAYYNNREDIPYKLYFDDYSFINRSDLENKTGTIVNLDFKLKENDN